MLVLDEPTNYLDRESLGALAAGIADYGGAVVMISHNSGEWGWGMYCFPPLGLLRGGGSSCCRRWACCGWGGWIDVLPPQRVLRLLPQSLLEDGEMDAGWPGALLPRGLLGGCCTACM